MGQYEGLGGLFLTVGMMTFILAAGSLFVYSLLFARKFWTDRQLKAQTKLLEKVPRQILDLYGTQGFLTATSVALMLSNIRRGVEPNLQIYKKHDLTLAIQVTEYNEEDIQLILESLDNSVQWVEVDGDSGFKEKLPTAERAAASVIRNLMLKLEQKEMS